MFFSIERENASEIESNTATTGKKKESGVPAVIATFACVLSVGLSGYLSLALTDPDQGKLVTLAEMSVRKVQQAEYIKNNPHMPPQAKRMALGALERSQAMGNAQNGSH